MMEEAALGDARRGAEIVDRGGGITLGTDDICRRFEDFQARLVGGLWGHEKNIPISRYVCQEAVKSN